MQTLGQLIDQLTIVTLKHVHADSDDKKQSTSAQMKTLSSEISGYLRAVLEGDIEITSFPQNKVYKRVTEVVEPPDEEMGFGRLVAGLVESNVRMWNNQEFVYNFREVPEDERVPVIDKCAALNIHRNDYMDAIDRWFSKKLEALQEHQQPSHQPEHP